MSSSVGVMIISNIWKKQCSKAPNRYWIHVIGETEIMFCKVRPMMRYVEQHDSLSECFLGACWVANRT